MKEIGMLFIGNWSEGRINGAVGEYLSLAKVLSMLEHGFSESLEVETLKEGKSLCLDVEDLYLLLTKIGEEDEAAKMFLKFSSQVYKGKVGMLTLSTATGERMQTEGDYHSFIAAIEKLEKPLRERLHTETTYTDTEPERVIVENETFRLTLEETETLKEGVEPQRLKGEVGALYICNVETTENTLVVGELSSLASVVSTIVSALKSEGIEPEVASGGHSLIANISSLELLLCELSPEEAHYRKYKQQTENLEKLGGMLQLIEGNKNSTQGGDYRTFSEALRKLGTPLEALFDLQTEYKGNTLTLKGEGFSLSLTTKEEFLRNAQELKPTKRGESENANESDSLSEDETQTKTKEE